MSSSAVVRSAAPRPRALLRRGFEVRLVNRRGRDALGPDAAAFADVEVLTGDATDAEFTTRAAANADAVYQTLNPEYYRWAEDFPPLQRGVLAAAQASGARYVSMDNVYSYGRPNGRVLDERTPELPHTKKGQIRLQMAREVWAAHEAGRVQAVSGRASDYYGPGGGAASPLGDRVLSAVVAGKRVSLFGNPDLRAHLHVHPRHRRGALRARHGRRRHGACVAPPQRPQPVDQPGHDRRALPAGRHSTTNRQHPQARIAGRGPLQSHRA